MTELETDELLTLLTHANNEIDRLITERDEWEQIAADLKIVITTLEDELQDCRTHNGQLIAKNIEECTSLSETINKLQKRENVQTYAAKLSEATRINEILEEKLVLCDRYYKKAVEKLSSIRKIINEE